MKTTQFKIGDTAYIHEGKLCFYKDIPSGSEVVIYGVQTESGIKKHAVECGIKP
jgi:hypothetical protein